jgi:hypothetical protein
VLDCNKSDEVAAEDAVVPSGPDELAVWLGSVDEAVGELSNASFSTPAVTSTCMNPGKGFVESA